MMHVSLLCRCVASCQLSVRAIRPHSLPDLRRQDRMCSDGGGGGGGGVGGDPSAAGTDDACGFRGEV